MKYRISTRYLSPVEVEADTLWDAIFLAGRRLAVLDVAAPNPVTKVEVYTLARGALGGVSAGWLECRPI